MKCHEDLRPKHKVDPSCVDTDSNKCELEDDMICEGEVCKPVYPKCAPMDKINEYLKTKTIQMRTINQQVNFAHGEYPIFENEYAFGAVS